MGDHTLSTPSSLNMSSSGAAMILLSVGLVAGQSDLSSNINQIADVATKVADFTEGLQFVPLGEDADLNARISQYTDLVAKATEFANGLNLGDGAAVASTYNYDINNPQPFNYQYNGPSVAPFNYQYRGHGASNYVYDINNPRPFNYQYRGPASSSYRY